MPVVEVALAADSASHLRWRPGGVTRSDANGGRRHVAPGGRTDRLLGDLSVRDRGTAGAVRRVNSTSGRGRRSVAWFEQPGGGSPYQFFDNGRPLSQAELQRLGIIAEITR